MSSFIRFSERRKVDLPQPDGPISAVTCCSTMSIADRTERLLLAVEDGQVADDQLRLRVGLGYAVGVGAHARTRVRRRIRARTMTAAMLSVKVSASSTSTVA